MRFGSALDLLRQGHKMTRHGWNGKGMWIAFAAAGAVMPGQSSTIQPFIYLRAASGALVPWVASQIDLLADDWACAE